MKRLFTLSALLGLIATAPAAAQQDVYRWRVGAYGGLMHYYGDLNEQFFPANRRLLDQPFDFATYGASAELSLSNSWGVRLMYTEGEFVANDRRVGWDNELANGLKYRDRALNARTEIQDLSLMFTYYLDDDIVLSRRAFLAPYFSFGAGLTRFDVFGNLFYGPEQNQRYYYWSDGTIRSLAESDPNAPQASVIEQDDSYETNLSDLDTEGEDYNQRILNIPMAVGLKFRLSDRFNVNLEMMAHYTFSDYLDDVGGDYQRFDDPTRAYAADPSGTGQPGTPRGIDGRNLNDIYTFTSISLHYNFGLKTDAYRAPRIYASQLSQMALARTDDFDEETGTASMSIEELQARADSVAAARRQRDNANMSRLRADSLARLPVALRANPSSDTLSRRPISDERLRQSQDTLSLERVDSLNTAIVGGIAAPRDSITTADTLARRRVQAFQRPFSPLPMPKDTLTRREVDSVATASQFDSVQTSLRDQQAQLTELRELILSLNRDTLQPRRGRSEATRNRRTNRRADTTRQAAGQGGGTNAEVERLRRENDELAARNAALEETVIDLRQDTDALRNDVNNLRDGDDRRERDSRLNVQPVVPIGGGQRETAEEEESEAMAELRRENERLRGRLDRMEDNRDAYGAQRNNLLPTLTTTGGVVAAPIVTDTDTTAVRADRDSLQTRIDSLRTAAATDTAAAAELRQLREERGALDDSLAAVRASLEAAREAALELEKAQRTNVFFATNSDEVTAADRERLERVATLIKRYPTVRVVLRGYTDKTGNAQYNMQLSQRRARSVQQTLEGFGVRADNITTEYHGADLETTQVDSSYGRRVEVVLTTEPE